MGENIITAIIICLVSMFMITIGITQLKSKDPVGFYSGEKPPKAEELTDVLKWNRNHGILWMFYGVAMILGLVVASLVGNEMIASIIIIAVILGGIPIMIAYHHYLKKKYYRQ